MRPLSLHLHRPITTDARNSKPQIVSDHFYHNSAITWMVFVAILAVICSPAIIVVGLVKLFRYLIWKR